jgi:NTE family protein
MSDVTGSPQALESGQAVPSEGGAGRTPGIALCLSGGGFRATLFHLGAVRRLNEFGMLSGLDVITSVSGGSILNGVLATRWPRLAIGTGGVITNFEEEIAKPVRAFCGTDIRTPLLLGTRLNPANWPMLLRDFFSVSAKYLAESYQPLYQRKFLREIPPPGTATPRFVFCATNMVTGACWHFHGGPQGRMGDFYTGYCDSVDVSVSEAVAASSAFTPGFSALRLRLTEQCKLTRIDPWGRERPVSAKRGGENHGSEKTTPILTDGGVYDNLGVEPVWGRYSLLVSDAGRPFASVSRSSQFFTTRLQRAINISLEQVGAVRKRWLVNELMSGRQVGALWAINSLLEEFPLGDAQGYGPEVRQLFGPIRTDLNSFTEGEIACLENHGYSLADAAIRSRAPSLCPNAKAPFVWPHDNWRDEARVCRALAKSGRISVLRDIGRLIVRLGRP